MFEPTSNVDRITQLLRQAAAPQTPDFMDTRTGTLAGYAAVYRGEDPMKSYQSASRMNVDQSQKDLASQAAAEMDIYKLVNDQKDRGNRDAAAVMEAVMKLSGDDPTKAGALLNKLHENPTEINAGNVYQLAIPAAAELGYTGKKNYVEVSPGASLFDPSTGKNVYTAPAKPKEARDNLSNDIQSDFTVLDEADRKISELIKEAEKNPTDFGAIGAAKGVAQTVTGVVGDIAKSFPLTSGVAAGAEKYIPDVLTSDQGPTARLGIDENFLTNALVRARTGGGRRALKMDVDKAKSDASLRGLSSSEQVIQRLQAIQEEIRRGKASTLEKGKSFNIDLKGRPSLEEIFNKP